MKKITVILLCMAMLLSGCAWSVKAEAVSSSEDVWKTIEEAYIPAGADGRDENFRNEYGGSRTRQGAC